MGLLDKVTPRSARKGKNHGQGKKGEGATDADSPTAASAAEKTIAKLKKELDESKVQALVAHANVEERDPRWDIAGFNETWTRLNIAWVKVGFIRQWFEEKRVVPNHQNCPDEALHFGAPPTNVQLYCLDYRWATRDHPDPERHRLDMLVKVLDSDGAFDEDLLLWDWFSAYQPNPDVKGLILDAWARFANTHFRIKTIVLPDAPVGEQRSSYFESMWCLHGFSVSTFTQRIVNSDHPAVSLHTTPEWLLQTDAKLQSAHCVRESDRKIVKDQRESLRKRMLPARTDALGFRTVCHAANFRWVLVSYVHELATRGGPAPRRQELPEGTYIDGVVPAGRQPWVVSYGWAAVDHFSPSGAKIRELSRALTKLGAKPTDIVFLDHMSMWQKGRELPKPYATANDVVDQMIDYRYGRVTQSEMTRAQGKEMRFALYESTRLYAFAGGVLPGGQPVLGCKVIVLPRIEEPGGFPEPGELKREMNTFCYPPREEIHSAWGFCKSLKYHQGGWTCAEYSVARKNGTIANAADADVQEVEAARAWPDDITAYAEMMDEEAEQPVAFTKRGDREAVRFNFFKYAYGFGGTQESA